MEEDQIREIFWENVSFMQAACGFSDRRLSRRIGGMTARKLRRYRKYRVVTADLVLRVSGVFGVHPVVLFMEELTRG